jgi:hypothetical protein
MSAVIDERQAFLSSSSARAPQAAAPPGISLSTGIASVSSEFYWGTATVTYSIAVTGSPWAGYNAGTVYDEPFKPEYSTFSVQQAAQFRLAIGKWDELIATSFVETSGVANIGDIRIAFSNIGAGRAAYAYFPPYGGSASSSLFLGDVWFAHTSTASSMAPGSFGFHTLLHELGHSLGLEHSFEGTIPLPSNLENYRYSVMSYTNITDSTVIAFSGTSASISGTFSYANFITPSLYDIAAVQQRYGADTATRAGATTYTWSATSTTLEVIYDAGGIDTWDLSAQTRASDIDLREGAYSSINRFTRAEQIAAAVATYGESNRRFIESYFNAVAATELYEWRDNVGIAFGTVIENVIGGSGNDTITGNAADNVLSGNSGADSLFGGLGADTLIGGAGSDTLDGGEGNDRIIYDAADAAVNIRGGLGTDTLVVTGGAAPVSFNLVAQGFEAAEHSFGLSGGASQRDVYDALWQRTGRSIFEADGSRSETRFDRAGNDWAQIDDYFANGGAYIAQTGYYDDGRSWSATFNLPGNDDYLYTYRTSGGVDDYKVGRFDDGRTYLLDFDQANAFTDWGQKYAVNDSLNRPDYEYGYRDTGQLRWYLDHDQDNSNASYRYMYTYYRLDGSAEYVTGLRDDGTPFTTFY